MQTKKYYWWTGKNTDGIIKTRGNFVFAEEATETTATVRIVHSSSQSNETIQVPVSELQPV